MSVDCVHNILPAHLGMKKCLWMGPTIDLKYTWTFLSRVWIFINEIQQNFCDVLLRFMKHGLNFTHLSQSKSRQWVKFSQEAKNYSINLKSYSHFFKRILVVWILVDYSKKAKQSMNITPHYLSKLLRTNVHIWPKNTFFSTMTIHSLTLLNSKKWPLNYFHMHNICYIQFQVISCSWN